MKQSITKHGRGEGAEVKFQAGLYSKPKCAQFSTNTSSLEWRQQTLNQGRCGGDKKLKKSR